MTLPTALTPGVIEAGSLAMKAKREELMNFPLARIYYELSTAALTAALEKLGETHVLVPREPTDEMLNRGDSMMPQIAEGQDITTGYDALKEAWPAMIAAAPGQDRES